MRGIPMYSPGDGLLLTVKRTPQGRASSSMRVPFAVGEFDLEGHEQQTYFEPSFFTDSPVMHHIALDYVSRPDGYCLTALLHRRGAKTFDPLAYVISKPMSQLALPAYQAADQPKRSQIRIRQKKVDDG